MTWRVPAATPVLNAWTFLPPCVREGVCSNSHWHYRYHLPCTAAMYNNQAFCALTGSVFMRVTPSSVPETWPAAQLPHMHFQKPLLYLLCVELCLRLH